MTEKYYTPSLWELYPGYDYEKRWFFINDDKTVTDGWTKTTFSEPFMLGDTLSGDIFNKQIRTEYLTEKQITDIGWVKCSTIRNGGTIQYRWKETNTCLEYSGGNFIYRNEDPIKLRSIAITELNMKKMNFESLYRGECKSINELKTLMTWLKIN